VSFEGLRNLRLKRLSYREFISEELMLMCITWVAFERKKLFGRVFSESVEVG